MIYKEEIRDLFSVSILDDYYFAHCISADFKMGAGIAVEFNKRFNTKMLLHTIHPNYWNYWSAHRMIGDCILEGSVFNLITKERYFHKPTYISMEYALRKMKALCEIYDIKKIAMPLIGCGLDRLNWDQVSEMIQVIFKDTDIEILVCRQ